MSVGNKQCPVRFQNMLARVLLPLDAAGEYMEVDKYQPSDDGFYKKVHILILDILVARGSQSIYDK